MRYTEKVHIDELRQKYDYLIGWGVGFTEYCLRYNPSLYTLDYMIDGLDHGVGSVVCGMEISPKSILQEILGKGTGKPKICFIIYPNPEYEILGQIQEYIGEYDFIVSRLIKLDTWLRQNYSTDNEDMILLEGMKRFGIVDPFYVDIGVCHPVIRNNTYLFYENGYYDGLLIEPNLDMCALASLYRPKNKVLPVGAATGNGGIMKYYMHPDSSWMGHNTFSELVARQGGFENNYKEIQAVNINQIFKDNCHRCPDVLDIDTEGMDYDLLNTLDTEEFPIKMICLERWKKETEFDAMMKEKGYIHYATTLENHIYVRKE